MRGRRSGAAARRQAGGLRRPMPARAELQHFRPWVGLGAWSGLMQRGLICPLAVVTAVDQGKLQLAVGPTTASVVR